MLDRARFYYSEGKIGGVQFWCDDEKIGGEELGRDDEKNGGVEILVQSRHKSVAAPSHPAATRCSLSNANAMSSCKPTDS